MLSRSLIFVSVLALGVIAPPQLQAQDPAAPGAPDDRAIELAFWNSVQAANECDAYKAYVTRYPDGVFVALARLGERRLCAQPAPAAAPTAPAADAPAATAQPAALAAPMPAAPMPAAPAPAEPPPQAAEAPAGPSNAELVRAVQTELKRVNCGDMDATGEWNKETEEAVVRFNDHARWRFDWKQPSASLLSALVRSGEYACALECVDGYKADGGACVPAADASPRPLPLPVVKRPRR